VKALELQPNEGNPVMSFVKALLWRQAPAVTAAPDEEDDEDDEAWAKVEFNE